MHYTSITPAFVLIGYKNSENNLKNFDKMVQGLNPSPSDNPIRVTWIIPRYPQATADD